MFDYYHYFAEKGNHPDEESILALEKNIDLNALFQKKEALLKYIVTHASKPVGVRIMIDGKEILHVLDESLGQESDQWLARKEKVVNETKHSSYYAFLHNMKTDAYAHMVMDESYAICGGGFPLYQNDILRGTFTVTGCRPNEDHQLVIDALEEQGLL